MPASCAVTTRSHLPLAAALAGLTGSLLLAVVAGPPATAGTETGKYAVTGSVLDVAGHPLDGTVTVYGRSGASWSQVRWAPVLDGELGVAVPPGDYRLFVNDSDNTLAGEFYGDAADLASATTVTVTDADVALETIVLEAPVSITGRVVDAAGAPVDGVELHAVPATDPNGWGSSASTDAAGRFRLTPGAGQFRIRIDDHRGRYATEWADDAPSHGFARTVVYDRATTQDLGDLTVGAGGSLAGRVLSDAGVPLRRVVVRAFDLDGRIVATTTTDRSGSYVLPHLAASAWRLLVQDEYGEHLPAWYGGGTSSDATPVVLGADEHRSLDDVRLTPATARPVPPGTDVSGVVVDELDRPAMGAVVRAYPADAVGLRRVAEYTTTDRAGRFHLTDLDGAGPVDYKIEVADESGHDDEPALLPTWYGGGSWARAARVRVVPGEPVDGVHVRMRASAVLTGRVTDESGIPLAGLGVTVLDAGGSYVDDAWTDTDGRYEVDELDPQRRYVVGVDGDGAHVSEWLTDAPTPAQAELVALPAGVTTRDVVLAGQLRALTAPAVRGTPVVGQQLTASPGAWNQATGTALATTWLRGTTVVGTGPSYRVRATDAGAALRVRVSAVAGELSGTATSAATAPTRHASTTRLTGRSAGRRVTLVVATAAAVAADGTVVVRDGTRVVGRVVLRAGRGTLVLRRQRVGRHVYAASYPGSTVVAPSAATRAMRVRR